MRSVWATLLVAAVGGCSLPSPTMPLWQASVERTGATGELTLSVRPAAYTLQAVVRRWLASDVYEYVVTLRKWSGTAYVDFDPPLTVVLPQKGAPPKQHAVFTNLKQGLKYRAVLVAWGNQGGTAPAYVLNSQTAETSLLDFTANQDVQDNQAASLQAQLDPIPFSGDAAIEVQNVPEGATAFAATLKDSSSGATLTTMTYPVGQRATFSHLKAGPQYQVVLTALQDTTPLQTATSAAFSWNASADSLDTARTVTVTF